MTDPLARILAHARTEATLNARNYEQLVLAIVIPIGLLIGWRALGDRFGLAGPSFPASVLALALWSTTFTTVAIATGFERRYGVLERLAATPLGRSGLLAGKAVATIALAAVQLGAVALAALLLGWHPALAGLPITVAIVVGVATAWAFTGAALALAGTARAEVTLGLANLIYVLGAGAGAVLLPVADYPGWLQPALYALPTAALGEAFRAAAEGRVIGWPLATAIVWALLASWAARRWFRWLG